ncbi:MAG: hypothetical protein H7Y01_06565 [Ferruginibacter sp.]|nr:hypothetical protein [Chitinophagaceae bacterium]
MEVHHHSHSARKKWTHYLWEFLMLFLAVFCGFLAENQREHYVEHQREKQYMRSLVADLQTDTANIRQANTWFEKISSACDTLMRNYEQFMGNASPETHRSFQFILAGYPDFVYTDRTIQQLKNSGGLRLVRDHDVSDSIVAYDANIRDMVIEESAITLFYDRLHELAARNFNFRELDEQQNNPGSVAGIVHWLTTNVQDKEQFYNILRVYTSTLNSYIRYRKRLLNKAARLIGLLNKNYHLD